MTAGCVGVMNNVERTSRASSNTDSHVAQSNMHVRTWCEEDSCQEETHGGPPTKLENTEVKRLDIADEEEETASYSLDVS